MITPSFRTDVVKIADSYSTQAILDDLRKNQGLKTEIYFDTYDVIKILQGVRVYDNNYKFDKERFDEDEALLVHSFAFKGWLDDQIHMLPPHRDELATKLFNKNSSVFPRYRIFKFEDVVKDLSYQTRFEQFSKKIDSIDPNDLETYLREVRLNAELLLKVHYLIEQVEWHKRFKLFFKDRQILQFDDEKYDLDRIIRQKRFEKIHRALNGTRSYGYQKSNYVDALALYILQEKLERHKEDNSQPLPLFFASSGGIPKAVDRLQKEGEDLFTYQNEHHQPITVVQESTFFLIDTLFSLENGNENIDILFKGIDKESNRLRDELKLAYNKYNYYQVSQDNKRENPEYQKEMEKHKQKFRKDVHRLIGEEFIKEIWLKKEAYRDLQDATKNYEEFVKQFDKKAAIDKVQQEIESLVQELNVDKERLELFVDITHSFRNLKRRVRAHFLPVEDGMDVFRDYGLIRFSYDRKDFEDIQLIVNELFQAAENKNEEEGIHSFNHCLSQVISFLITGLYDSNQIKNLLTGLGILWILEENQLIINIGNRLYPNYPHAEIALMHAAALCLEGKGRSSRVKEIIECVERHLREKPSYKIQIGLAYVYFRIWEEWNNQPDIPELLGGKEGKRLFTGEGRQYYDRTIHNIRQALDYLEANKNKDEQKRLERNQRYIFALNNYIYYLTKGGAAAEFDSLKEKTQQFRRLEAVPNFWQGRFYDTLGWYYLRTAYRSSQGGEAIDFFLKQAKRFNQYAQDRAKTPRDKRTYDRLLELIEMTRLDEKLF